MFRTRLISGIVLVLIALVVVITGGPVLAATLFIISEIGVFELYRVLKVQDAGFSPLAAVGYLGTAAYYAIVFFGRFCIYYDSASRDADSVYGGFTCSLIRAIGQIR